VRSGSAVATDSSAAILFDAQALQNPWSAERGIGRYVNELIRGLIQLEHADPIKFLLNRALPVPSALEPLITQSDIAAADVVAPETGVLHVPSPFEPVRVSELWPEQIRHLRLVVTVHDLIPDVFPSLYLHDVQVRQWYKNRLRFVRQADLVVVPSEATARDVARRLRFPKRHIVVTGEAPPESFVPTTDRRRVFEELSAAMPTLKAEFVLYIGGMDLRKNVWGLLEAYADLPNELQAAHQLVVVCALTAPERRRVRQRLKELGVESRVYFTGYLPDEDVVRLCQTAHLFVFPSLYEGYGLPVAEAMACRAPVIAADTSAVRELIDYEGALFNPYDQRSIQDALERGLVDDRVRAELARQTLPEDHTWPVVAARTQAAYDRLRSRPARRHRRRPRIAFLSPLPPERTGVADYSLRLLAELQDFIDVDAFVDGGSNESAAIEGVHVRKLIAFDALDSLRGGYAAIVCSIGNSAHHIGSLALLRRRRAVVLAHDLRLTDLYAAVAHRRPDLEPTSYRGAFERMYDRRYPAGRSGVDSLAAADLDRYGILMAREVIARSEKFLVHSEFAARLARLEASRRDHDRIEVVPFGHPSPAEFPTSKRSSEPIVATFGLATRLKQVDLLIDAMPVVAAEIPGVRLEIVGTVRPRANERWYRARIASRGLGARADVTGRLDEGAYRERLANATVAVQLRSSTYGENSAAVAACLAAGIPTIVRDIGSARELPDNAVVKLSDSATADDLANELLALLRNPARRSSMGRAAQNYARAHSFAAAAEAVYRAAISASARRAAP